MQNKKCRVCSNTKSYTYQTKSGQKERWYGSDGSLCGKCYGRLGWIRKIPKDASCNRCLEKATKLTKYGTKGFIPAFSFSTFHS